MKVTIENMKKTGVKGSGLWRPDVNADYKVYDVDYLYKNTSDLSPEHRLCYSMILRALFIGTEGKGEEITCRLVLEMGDIYNVVNGYSENFRVDALYEAMKKMGIDFEIDIENDPQDIEQVLAAIAAAMNKNNIAIFKDFN